MLTMEVPFPAGESEAMPGAPAALRRNSMWCQVLICLPCEDGLESIERAEIVLIL